MNWIWVDPSKTRGLGKWHAFLWNEKEAIAQSACGSITCAHLANLKIRQGTPPKHPWFRVYLEKKGVWDSSICQYCLEKAHS